MNNKFLSLYLAEFKKMFRAKGLIKLFVIMLIFAILCTIAFYIIGHSLEEVQMQLPIEENAFVSSEEAIYYYENTLKMLETSKSDFKWYQYKATKNYINGELARYKYLKENNLAVDTELIFGINALLKGESAIDYVYFILSAMGSIILIYCVAIATGSITNEYKNGTLKILLLRPITRGQVLFAKLLAIFTVAVGLLLFTTIAALIYSLFNFNITNAKALVVFNNSSAYIINSSVKILYAFLLQVASIFAYVIFAFSLAVIIKNKTLSLVISLILILLGSTVSQWLAYIGIDYLLLTNHFDFTKYLMPNSQAYGFVTSILVYLISLPMFCGGALYVFNKRDI